MQIGAPREGPRVRLDALEVYARPYEELADEILAASGSGSARPGRSQPVAEPLASGSAMGPQLPGSFLGPMLAGQDLLAQTTLTSAQLSHCSGARQSSGLSVPLRSTGQDWCQMCSLNAIAFGSTACP